MFVGLWWDGTARRNSSTRWGISCIGLDAGQVAGGHLGSHGGGTGGCRWIGVVRRCLSTWLFDVNWKKAGRILIVADQDVARFWALVSGMYRATWLGGVVAAGMLGFFATRARRL